MPQVKGNVGVDPAEALLGGQFNWQSRTPSSDPSTRIDPYGRLNPTGGVHPGDRVMTLRGFVNTVLDKSYPVAIGSQFSNFGNQPATDFLPGHNFRRYAGISLSAEL